jgi:hypothetical protein
MVYLAVGAMFKNEAHILKEWIEHYIYHGVEHFYLIDDASTDDSLQVLEPYIASGLVEVFTVHFPYYLGRQKDLYNKYIFPRIKETQWLLMCDLDEFLWSPQSIDLKWVLRGCEHIGEIQVEHTMFGSSGLIEIPPSAVAAYTMRSEELCTQRPGLRKYLINTRFEFKRLCVHSAEFERPEDEKNAFLLLGPEWFRLNHYNCQAKKFWDTVKCTRGDSDNYKTRIPADFEALDRNEVEDRGLLEQNLSLLERLSA